MLLRWRFAYSTLLRTLLLVVFLLAFEACDIKNDHKILTPVNNENNQYQESPMLKKRVEAGELPPVEDRLPDEPLVIDVLEIGEYGGTIGGGDVIQSEEWHANR